MKSTNRIRRSAFTLIELLTVIAIIAVLAAIIFPVFGAVRENARRSSCMSNMHQIAVGVKQYELDNRKYPDFLFSPALKSDGANSCEIYTNPDNPSDPNINSPIIAADGDAACTVEQASGTGRLGGTYLQIEGEGVSVVGVGSLYPEYVKSVNTFLCPDNSWFNPVGDAGFNNAPTNLPDYPVTAPLTRYNTTTTTSASLIDKNTVRYYKFDSYDANPIINKSGAKALPSIRAAQGNWQLRYSRQWMNGVTDPTNLATIAAADQPFYNKQMIWKDPSDDTVLTMCSFHVPTSSKVVVVFLSGTAKVYDLKVLADKGTSPTSSDFASYRMTP